jgi:hypothetical protein
MLTNCSQFVHTEFIKPWYNIDNERGNNRGLDGMAFKSETEVQRKKPLDKTPQMWYNKCGK